jgi:tetratricopeptide (TPR) repeat protein
MQHSYQNGGKKQPEFAEAESLGIQALQLLEGAEGPEHPDVANVLNHLGGVHLDRGDYQKAEVVYQRAVRIMDRIQSSLRTHRAKRVRPPDFGGNEDLARLFVQSLNGLATLRRLQGRYAEAEPLIRRALNLAEKSFPAADLEIASTLNSLGVLYKYQNRFAEAERQYRRALGIMEMALGPEHLFTPLLLAGALALAAAGVGVEAMLFRGLFDLARELPFTQQRLGAMGLVVAFLVLLLVLELPIAAGLLRMGRRLEIGIRLAFLEKLPRLVDRYFQSRLVSDMAERSHSLHELRALPTMGGQLLHLLFALALSSRSIAEDTAARRSAAAGA